MRDNGRPARHVGASSGIAAEPRESDDPERTIGVAVAAPIQAMAVLPSRRRVNRRYAAERSKGRLTRETLGVVARGDEEVGLDVLRCTRNYDIVPSKALRTINDRALLPRCEKSE